MKLAVNLQTRQTLRSAGVSENSHETVFKFCATKTKCRQSRTGTKESYFSGCLRQKQLLTDLTADN